MGETDVETMANVTIAQYDFDDEAFDSISNDAKDFIKKLLVKDHKYDLPSNKLFLMLKINYNLLVDFYTKKKKKKYDIA